jgi:acyl carrier protein
MEQVRDVIVSSFQAKNALAAIGLDDDFFDLGVSSLTIISMQIDVEQRLGVTIDTPQLMRFSTINQWIDAYTERVAGAVKNSAEKDQQ